MNFENIADELKALNQWCLWKLEIRDGKQTKIPYQTTGIKAESNNPQTWNTFEAVITELQNNNTYNGIGFMLSDNDDNMFCDLDKCVDPQTKEIESWAKDILKKLNSYSEYSQSGTGIHVVFRAKHPDGAGCRKGHFEMYSEKHFLAITGNRLAEYPLTIESRQNEINSIADSIWGKLEPEPTKTKPSSVPMLTDNEIKTVSKNDDKFNRLMTGDWQNWEYESQSDADCALCCKLCFYSGGDYDQIDRMFRMSGLYNTIDRKGSDRHIEYYIKRTINFALDVTKEYFKPKLQTKSSKGDPVSTEAKQADKSKEKKSPYFEGNTFIPKRLADELMSEHEFICADGVLYEYTQGYYKALSDDMIDSMCCKKLGDDSRANRASEVIFYIKAITRIEPDILNTNKELINFENCVYNWKTGAVSKHSKELFSTVRIPIKLDADAKSEVITDWLYSTLRDPELITLALELFGYCLTTDVTMSKAFMLVGSGSNGKSTFLTVLEKFIGHDNVCKIPLQELSDHRFKRAELFGKLVNLFADLDSKALESTSYFKTIVSGDSIDAERKNQNPFFFRPFAKLVFSANEIPRSRDRSHAYYRRWCIIPFNQKFEGENEKKDLAEQLTRPENLSALLNCALKELTNVYKRQAFSQPQATIEAINEYEKQNDPVKAFIDECCQFEPYSRIERGELYNAFNRFCEDSGYRTVTNRHFYQRLRIFREIKEIRTPTNRMFEGVKLIDTLL